jgi:hypothetical protein
MSTYGDAYGNDAYAHDGYGHSNGMGLPFLPPLPMGRTQAKGSSQFTDYDEYTPMIGDRDYHLMFKFC